MMFRQLLQWYRFERQFEDVDVGKIEASYEQLQCLRDSLLNGTRESLLDEEDD